VSTDIRYHIARMGKEDLRFEYNGAKCFNLAIPDIQTGAGTLASLTLLKRYSGWRGMRRR